MASSRVMASSSSANSDLARLPSAFSLTKNVGSLNMDDLLRNIYASPSPSTSKYAEEVWREISACRPAVGEDGATEEVTLEAFLPKAGAVDEDVRGIGMFAADPALQQQLPPEIEAQLFGNGVGGSGGRRRKRGTADPVDKVAMQRQKRMIKNRGSAARSRERKQAYTMELEALASKLEDENTELVKYQEEQDRIRFKQVLDSLKGSTRGRRHMAHSGGSSTARPHHHGAIQEYKFTVKDGAELSSTPGE